MSSCIKLKLAQMLKKTEIVERKMLQHDFALVLTLDFHLFMLGVIFFFFPIYEKKEIKNSLESGETVRYHTLVRNRTTNAAVIKSLLNSLNNLSNTFVKWRSRINSFRTVTSLSVLEDARWSPFLSKRFTFKMISHQDRCLTRCLGTLLHKIV